MDKCACVVHEYLASQLYLLTIECVELGAIVHNVNNAFESKCFLF
jgi:hypothetical protein